jgi:hypothetical protein
MESLAMEKRVGVLRGVFNTLMRLFRSLLRKLKDLERKAGVECGRFGQAGEVIFISCDDIGFPDTEVTELLNGFKADREHALNGFGLGNEEQAQRVYDGTLRNFTRIKKEGNFEKMYMENGKCGRTSATMPACTLWQGLFFTVREFRLYGSRPYKKLQCKSATLFKCRSVVSFLFRRQYDLTEELSLCGLT